MCVQDLVDKGDAIFFLGDDVHGVERTAHEHGNDQNGGEEDALKIFQDVGVLPYDDFRPRRMFPLLAEGRESGCGLLKDLKLIPSD